MGRAVHGRRLPNLLRACLFITGIMAFAALLGPDVMYVRPLGRFIQINVPDLSRSLAPTAFLWGCVYAGVYWLVRSRLLFRWAAPAAFVFSALVLWLIPQPSVFMARRTLARYRLADVTPPAPIRPQGDILLDTGPHDLYTRKYEHRSGRSDPVYYACNSRCLALLFKPGVRSVTLTWNEEPDFEDIRAGRSRFTNFEDIRDGRSRLTNAARTWWLLPRSQCGDRAPAPGFDFADPASLSDLSDDRQVEVLEWRLKLLADACLVSGPPIDRHDMLIRTGSWWIGSGGARPVWRSGWPMGEAFANYGEIRGPGGSILFRRFDLMVPVLSAPLSIARPPRFPFWRIKYLPPRVSADRTYSASFYIYTGIDRALDILLRPDPEDVLMAASKAVRTALADPSSTDARGAALTGIYMNLLMKVFPTPRNLALITDLLRGRDRRLTHFLDASESPDPEHWDPEAPDTGPDPKTQMTLQLNDLQPRVIRRLLTMPDAARRDMRLLGWALEKWPEGAFANPDRATLALLADPVRRQSATGLIARLSDMGVIGAPIAANIIRWHADPSRASADRSSVISAGVRAMCRLGPLAEGQLSKMLEVERRFPRALGDGSERRAWDRMMVRIGKPLDRIGKPANIPGSEEDYLNNLRDWLGQFNNKRSCT